jgi:SAM-dependent methyltransferase
VSDPHERALAREFDRWAHDGTDQAMERGHGRFTEVALAAWELRPEHRVLDVGCGNGWAVRRMIQRGAGDGAGVDISDAMVALATPPGTYLRALAHDLPFPSGSFTHLLSVEALYYTADPEAALREWARVTQPGGQLMVLIDLYRENPCWRVWKELFPFEVAIRSEADWAASLATCGWAEVTQRRILDPRGPRPEADFEPDAWSPSYADYLAEKAAGTLCLRAVRSGLGPRFGHRPNRRHAACLLVGGGCLPPDR